MALSLAEENLDLKAKLANAKERIKELEAMIAGDDDLLDKEETKNFSPQEREVMRVLIKTYPNFVHRDKVFRFMTTDAQDSRVVDVAMSRFRRKHGIEIETRHKEGWRLASPFDRERLMSKTHPTMVS